MPKCWERYGEKSMNSEMIEQHLDIFGFHLVGAVKDHSREQIRVWASEIPDSQNRGLLIILIEGSVTSLWRQRSRKTIKSNHLARSCRNV